MNESAVLTVADVSVKSLRVLLDRYGLVLEVLAEGVEITGSFWGDSEAGLKGNKVYVRNDTPVHSLLHESCHVICMSPDRRSNLHKNAGGDDLEEAAVCYLQVVLAARLEGVGAERLMRDMDAWGYSFRLGNTRRWFEQDSDDARAWLEAHEVLDSAGEPSFQLRQ